MSENIFEKNMEQFTKFQENMMKSATSIMEQFDFKKYMDQMVEMQDNIMKGIDIMVNMKPEDADSLVECVNRLVADEALCQRLGENAYSNIAMVHNRDKQAEDYLMILQEIQSK